MWSHGYIGIRDKTAGFIVFILFCAYCHLLAWGEYRAGHFSGRNSRFTWRIPKGAVRSFLTAAAAAFLGRRRTDPSVSEKHLLVGGIYLTACVLVLFFCRTPDSIPFFLNCNQRFLLLLQPDAAGWAAAGLGMKHAVPLWDCPRRYFPMKQLGSLAIFTWNGRRSTMRRAGDVGMFEVFFDTILVCTVPAS